MILSCYHLVTLGNKLASRFRPVGPSREKREKNPCGGTGMLRGPLNATLERKRRRKWEKVIERKISGFGEAS